MPGAEGWEMGLQGSCPVACRLLPPQGHRSLQGWVAAFTGDTAKPGRKRRTRGGDDTMSSPTRLTGRLRSGRPFRRPRRFRSGGRASLRSQWRGRPPLQGGCAPKGAAYVTTRAGRLPQGGCAPTRGSPQPHDKALEPSGSRANGAIDRSPQGASALRRPSRTGHTARRWPATGPGAASAPAFAGYGPHGPGRRSLR